MRIIISWLPILGGYRLSKAILAMTAPITGPFARLKFLRIGPVDFSPLIVLLLLISLRAFLREWIERGAVNIFYLVSIFFSALINIGAFFALAFLMLIVIRLLCLLFPQAQFPRVIIDQILQPIVYHTYRVLRIKPPPSYSMQLAVGVLLLAFLTFGLRVLGAWILLR